MEIKDRIKRINESDLNMVWWTLIIYPVGLLYIFSWGAIYNYSELLGWITMAVLLLSISWFSFIAFSNK